MAASPIDLPIENNRVDKEITDLMRRRSFLSLGAMTAAAILEPITHLQQQKT
jgi:hypothetical protein